MRIVFSSDNILEIFNFMIFLKIKSDTRLKVLGKLFKGVNARKIIRSSKNTIRQKKFLENEMIFWSFADFVVVREKNNFKVIEHSSLNYKILGENKILTFNYTPNFFIPPDKNIKIININSKIIMKKIEAEWLCGVLNSFIKKTDENARMERKKAVLMSRTKAKTKQKNNWDFDPSEDKELF